jgi:predicted transposase/invertase (TIGR01784 family)
MIISKFLDPKNNFAFQRIFGTEKNKDILIHFLNDVVIFKQQKPIVDVAFLKTVQDPEIAAQKTSIVDILCIDEEGNTYVVEMQIAQEKGFEKRAQYYAAKAYASQLLVGGKYYDLKEVIFVAIADFIMFPQKQAYKSDHIILDQANHDHDLKDFSFTFLELPKFKKTIDQLETPIENWCYFFKHAPETSEKDISKLSMYPIIERAYGELNRFSWSPEELLTYDQSEKYEGAHLAALEFQYDKGMEKGLQEGIEKGKHDVARALLKRGIPLELVAEATGLSKKTLETL